MAQQSHGVCQEAALPFRLDATGLGTAEMGADTSGMITNPRERDQGLDSPNHFLQYFFLS